MHVARSLTMVVVVASVLFCAAPAFAAVRAPAPALGASNVELFVEGMAYGLAEEIGNITECIADIELTEQGACPLSIGVQSL